MSSAEVEALTIEDIDRMIVDLQRVRRRKLTAHPNTRPRRATGSGIKGYEGMSRSEGKHSSGTRSSDENRGPERARSTRKTSSSGTSAESTSPSMKEKDVSHGASHSPNQAKRSRGSTRGHPGENRGPKEQMQERRNEPRKEDEFRSSAKTSEDPDHQQKRASASPVSGTRRRKRPLSMDFSNQRPSDLINAMSKEEEDRLDSAAPSASGAKTARERRTTVSDVRRGRDSDKGSKMASGEKEKPRTAPKEKAREREAHAHDHRRNSSSSGAPTAKDRA